MRDFSLGMKQRLGLAMTLLHEPEFLILDEPTNGLDPTGIIEMRVLLKDLAQKNSTTILISSHILSELSQLSTNYGIIHKGKLVKQLSADELSKECTRYLSVTTNDTERSVAALKKSLPDLDYREISNKEMRIFGFNDKAAVVNRLLVEAGIAVHALHLMGQDLETFYFETTGGVSND